MGNESLDSCCSTRRDRWLPRLARAGLHLLIAAALVCSASPAQERAAEHPAVEIPAAQRRVLEQAALALAATDKKAETEELLAMLEATGHPAKALARVRERIAKTKPTARGVDRTIEKTAQSLVRVADQLAARLSSLPDEDRALLAALIVSLSGEQAEARAVLGFERVGDRWLDEPGRARAARRAAIQAKLQEARRLDVPVEVRPSSNPVLREVLGVDGLHLSWRGLHMHTAWPEAKARRVIQNVVRAIAFSHWLIGGELRLPVQARHENVLLSSTAEYAKAIAIDLAARRVSEREARDAPGLAGYYRTDQLFVQHRPTENHAFAGLFCHVAEVVSNQLHVRKEQPCLIVGHVCWLLMAFSGAQMPSIRWREADEHARGRTETVRDEREEMRLLSGAGLCGVRSWLRYLAARGEDPPWSRSFLDRVGKVDGEDMLKSAIVVEFLQERGPLAKTLEHTRRAVGASTGEVVASVERAVGTNLHDFEGEWRAWLLGDGEASLVIRLSRSTDSDVSPGEQAALAELHRIRAAALTHPWLQLGELAVDPDLSAGAREHAEYLARNPEQKTRWPDAHEEYSDHEGFSPEGCWAGAHSVVAPGVRGPEQAIDAFMATFYHRLPLIQPGVLRIGYGFAESTVVLDTGSVVRPVEFPWSVVWPPDEMKDVPRSFRPEMPNPLPGEDQASWGYPITLQLGPRSDGSIPTVELTLSEGSAGGPDVPCRLSSPQQPGNPLLVPEMAWCLIPKEHLKAHTVYHVTALIHGGDSLEWSFETGAGG